MAGHTGHRRRRACWACLTVFLAITAAIGAACDGDDTASVSPTATSEVAANLLLNGGFEAGAGPWFSLTSAAWGEPFAVSSDLAHSGAHSAYLELRAPTGASGSKVYGVVQEVSPERFPELISGYYYVDDWARSTSKQYLQFVVIAFGATNMPGGHSNHQIRYPLAGIQEQPFAISNARFVFLTRQDPPIGDWVYFERPIARDFRELWGAVPDGFVKLRILFEVRYDEKSPATEGSADVYFDDLYMGPAAGNPSQP